jgi:hypothetical protein
VRGVREATFFALLRLVLHMQDMAAVLCSSGYSVWDDSAHRMPGMHANSTPVCSLRFPFGTRFSHGSANGGTLALPQAFRRTHAIGTCVQLDCRRPRERINYKLGLSGDAVGLCEEIMDRIMSTSVGHRGRREADESKIRDLTIHAKQRSP